MKTFICHCFKSLQKTLIVNPIDIQSGNSKRLKAEDQRLVNSEINRVFRVHHDHSQTKQSGKVNLQYFYWVDGKPWILIVAILMVVIAFWNWTSRRKSKNMSLQNTIRRDDTTHCWIPFKWMSRILWMTFKPKS
jgi:hypothetical protein